MRTQKGLSSNSSICTWDAVHHLEYDGDDTDLSRVKNYLKNFENWEKCSAQNTQSINGGDEATDNKSSISDLCIYQYKMESTSMCLDSYSSNIFFYREWM